MEWTAWIPTAISAAVLLVVFVGKHSIKSQIERSIQHRFDKKIETLKGDIRKNEEDLKSDLRRKETQISALQDGVLSGRVNRQALLNKRQIEAVERVWASVNELSPYKVAAASMASINFDAAAKRAPHEPDLRTFFGTIGKTMPDKAFVNPAVNERPFISPIAWALLTAYQTILLTAFARLKILEIGVDDASKILDNKKIETLLKTTLPHQSEIIDKMAVGSYYYLLDEIEEQLLAELRNLLEGVQADEATVRQSAKILNAVNEVVAEDGRGDSPGDQLARASSPT